MQRLKLCLKAFTAVDILFTYFYQSSSIAPSKGQNSFDIDVLFSHRNLHECMSGGIPHAISHISMLFTISCSLHGYFTVYCIIIVIIIYISTFYMDI